MADAALGDLTGDALSLAVRASAAAHVDSSLLRRLRLRFLTRSDASIEADVWRSMVVESHTSNAITFSSEATSVLRRLLAGSSWVRETCDEIAVHHAGGPPLLLLEERLIRLGLLGETQSIQEALGEVLVSLETQAERADTILHWANQALPGLPPAVHSTTAAWALSLAVQRTYEREVLPGVPPPGLESFDLRAYLPEGTAPIVVRNEDGKLVFATSGDGDRIDVPATHPRVVVIDRTTSRETVRLRDGEEVRVDNVTFPVELRDLRGNRWRVHAIEEDAVGGPVVMRLLAVANLRASPDNLDEIVRRLASLRPQELDAFLIIGDLVAENFDNPKWREEVSSRLSTVVDKPIVLPGNSSSVIERDGFRLGIVGLGAPSSLAIPTEGTQTPTIADHLGHVLKGDHPALYREEHDAALLLSARDLFDQGYARYERDAALLDVFDVRLTGPRSDAMAIGRTSNVPVFLGSETNGPCALLAELKFEDRQFRSGSVAWLRANGRDTGVSAGLGGAPGKRTGRRAAQRRLIIRTLRVQKNVLLVGAQATGKTALIAEIAGGKWMHFAKVPDARTAMGIDPGMGAIASTFDPGEDVPVLQEQSHVPVLVESPMLPFEYPEANEGWEIVQLERLDLADVLDGLMHVAARKRAPIAGWLLDETAGDPWLIWRAIAGARLRGADAIENYWDPLAQAATASLGDIDDPAALELLVALCKNARQFADPRARWKLEHLGFARWTDESLRLAVPLVRKILTDELIERLRVELAGAADGNPRMWIELDDALPSEWLGAIASALARVGAGLQERRGISPVGRLLIKMRGAHWVRIAGHATWTIRAREIGVVGIDEIVVAKDAGPDQAFTWVTESLQSRGEGSRRISEMLDELGVYDVSFVSVGPDIARKAARRTQVAEVPGVKRIRVSDEEARRLLDAGARRRARGARSDDLREQVSLGQVDLGESDAQEDDESNETAE